MDSDVSPGSVDWRPPKMLNAVDVGGFEGTELENQGVVFGVMSQSKATRDTSEGRGGS